MEATGVVQPPSPPLIIWFVWLIDAIMFGGTI